MFYLTGVFTQSAMKTYKSLEAHRFFRSGFVLTVYHVKTPGNVVFKADVRPSQRMNDPSHQPWVAANGDGTVLTAHCTCMAG